MINKALAPPDFDAQPMTPRLQGGFSSTCLLLVRTPQRGAATDVDGKTLLVVGGWMMVG